MHTTTEFTWIRIGYSESQSEIELRKINPNATCFYSAASMFLRSLSAAFQSCFSRGSSLVSFAALVPSMDISDSQPSTV